MMLSATVLLILQSLCFFLRVSSGGSFPQPLSAAEEKEALKLAAAGDLDARNKLIEHNLRLVAHVVKKYYASAMDPDDLISIGTIGLIKAISSFNPDRGAKLGTYAARCVENEILMYFRSLRRQIPETSLSEPIDSDSEGNDLSYQDVIASDECILDKIDADENRARLLAALDRCLEPREKEIVCLRYGIGGKKPLAQREVAAHCNISRSYVSRIEKKALQKLRTVLVVDDI